MANIKIDLSKKRIFNHDESTNFTYKDIGTSNLKLIKDANNNTTTLYDINTYNIDQAAIKASLQNILNCKNGELILEPEFGIGPIYELLYSPFDKHIGQKLIATIKDIIAKWEPRIQVLSVPATFSEEEQEYNLEIKYLIPSLSVEDSYIFQISK